MKTMENGKVIQKVFYVASTVAALLIPHSMVSAEENTSFNVNVKESLSVSIVTPTEWASGDIDTFLRNKVSINITSNNAGGFTASMTTKTASTDLTNMSKNTYTMPTLASAVQRSAFPANYWGYSLDDTENGSDSSTYSALVGAGSTPITILSSNSATTGSKDFYFGAKADVTQAAGTYMGTVVISVVSGVVDNSTNPITPVNPVNPGPEEVATYDPGRDTTQYTYTRTSTPAPSTPSTTTTTTQISSGDNRSAYEGYTPPQGVTYSTKSTVNNQAGLATGLGVAAAVAATSGFFFLAAARRRDDDDEEDQQQSILTECDII